MAVSGKCDAMKLMQGAVKELHAHERKHKKDRDDHQHQDNPERDYALLSDFSFDVPRHDGSGAKRNPAQGTVRGFSVQ